MTELAAETKEQIFCSLGKAVSGFGAICRKMFSNIFLRKRYCLMVNPNGTSWRSICMKSISARPTR
jgi:hypothetical protein